MIFLVNSIKQQQAQLVVFCDMPTTEEDVVCIN